MSPDSTSPAVRRIWSVQVALALLLALSLVVPFISSPRPAAAAGAYTTTALNLRAGPSTGNYIKLTMPEGAFVELLSGLGNAGFYKVSYNGELGYAWGEYLSIDGNAGFEPGTINGSTAWTTDSLNLRSGPSTGHGIHLVMPPGTEVQLTGAVDGGFSGVVYAGFSGWASNDYLRDGDGGGGAPDPGDGDAGSLFVLSSLNLRNGPGTTYTVLDVMPGGAEVAFTGEVENGFAGVRYDGTAGWASLDYLSDSPPSDEPDPGADGVYTYDELIGIIYAAAAAYGQNGDAMLAVARCESVMDPGAYNGSSGASGLFQFLPGTWATTPYAAASIFDPVANANAAAWMWSVGRRGEWVC